MWPRTKCSVAIVALLLLAPQKLKAQEEWDYPREVFGVFAGYFQPIGAWAEHPYAQGVNWFGGGPAFKAEFEIKRRNAGVALFGSYAKLNLSTWEDYTRAHEDQVEAWAFLIHLGAAFRLYFIDRTAEALHLEIGLCYAAPSGHERFAQRAYDYDFMKSGFGFMTGMGYDHYISDRVALALRFGGVFVPGSVEFADGRKFSLTGLSILLGLRLVN